jgi:hypothetical protein
MVERCQLHGRMRYTSALLPTLCIAALTIEPARAQEQDWSLDIDGQLRERFESTNNPVFGLSTPMQNDYFLHRAMLSGEFRHGADTRALAQIVSGFASSWTDTPPATQEDPLDILQAYIEQSVPIAGGQLAWRIGRQEMTLGASRLVSVRSSPNIRRAFDGVSSSWTDGEDRRTTVFLVQPVLPEDGVFDDRSSSAQRFWGLYVTWPATGFELLKLDTYYLGLDRADGVFAQGEAHERRHTVGARAFGDHAGWDWNIEAAWQWGSFGAASIRAWTVSVDTGFELSALPLSPRIGLKADAISGDDNPDDRRLGTFNPLFPKLPYFSEANLTTPANLLDVQPSVRLTFTERLSTTVSWNRLWKHAAADSFYAPLLSPVADTSRTRSRDIGWQASMLVEWHVAKRLDVGATYVVFEPHSVVRQARGRAGSFFGAWIQWEY